MTDPRELKDRSNLGEAFASPEEIAATYASSVAHIAYIVAREELERAGIPLAPYQTREERGMWVLDIEN
ncbi:hypothetical protein [Dermabacter hominis]|mgnify:CR=1 FL=1|uniref:hypothetical protein n=1 Tax=Dermabacter hominis TaxID=36740 RepID=UPI002432A083|nr:hypothetical protein [Dermabacter hominis]